MRDEICQVIDLILGLGLALQTLVVTSAGERLAELAGTGDWIALRVKLLPLPLILQLDSLSDPWSPP